MLLLVLFIVRTAAVPSFWNSTSTDSSAIPTTITSLISPVPSETKNNLFIPCYPDDGMVCSRSGIPSYPRLSEPYQNPYHIPGIHSYSEAESSLRDYCGNIWANSLTSWLNTAPLSFGSTIPETTITHSAPDQTFTPEEVVYLSTWTVLVTFTGLAAAQPGDTPYTTEVEYYVNTVGVEEPYSKTLAIVTHTGEHLQYLESTTTFTNVLTGLTSAFYTQSAFASGSFISDFSYIASSPCCSSCTLYGDNVQVFYWPTPAPSHSISVLIDSSNFTFISPSVYVAFQSLFATDLCGTVGPKSFTPTTIAFRSDELSTALAYRYNTIEYASRPPEFPPRYTKATWGDQTDCRDIITSVSQDYGIYTVTYNRCSPTISVPTELFTINPLWSSCSQGIAGLYDPPYILNPGNGLSGFATPTADLPANIVPISTSASKTAEAGQGAGTTTLAPTGPTLVYFPTDPNTQKPNSKTKIFNSQTQEASNQASPSAVEKSDPSTVSPSDPGIENPGLALLTLGSSTFSANLASAFVIGSKTLTPGGEITHGALVLSLDPQGSSLVIDGSSTSALGHVLTEPFGNDPTQTVAKPTITATPIIIGSQTLIPGGPVLTVSGKTLSFQGDGSSIVVDGKTVGVSEVFGSTAEYIFGTQTLKAGGSEITISGTQVSLVLGGSSAVVGGVTTALSQWLASGTATINGGIGEIIIVIGGFGSPTTSTASYVQTGGGYSYNGTMYTGFGNTIRGRLDMSLWIWQTLLWAGLLKVIWL